MFEDTQFVLSSLAEIIYVLAGWHFAADVLRVFCPDKTEDVPFPPVLSRVGGRVSANPELSRIKPICCHDVIIPSHAS